MAVAGLLTALLASAFFGTLRTVTVCAVAVLDELFFSGFDFDLTSVAAFVVFARSSVFEDFLGFFETTADITWQNGIQVR